MADLKNQYGWLNHFKGTYYNWVRFPEIAKHFSVEMIIKGGL